MKINYNNFSSSLYKYYKNYNKNCGIYSARISSGEKISKPKDDPNLFYKSQTKESEINALDIGNRNMQDTVSMIQCQDSALSNISDMISKMKDLNLQVKSNINDSTDILSINKEIENIKSGIQDIIYNTKFNDVNGLCNYNKDNTFNLYTGLDNTNTISIPTFNISLKTLGAENNKSLSDINVINGDLDTNINIIDNALTEINDMRSNLGSANKLLEDTIDYSDSKNTLITKQNSQIKDSDLAFEMINFTKTNVMKDVSLAIMSQCNNLSKNSINILQNNLRK